MSQASDPNIMQKHRAQALFQTGNDAAMKDNLAYAIDMYREALKLDPENLLYRQSLRGAERRRFGNDPAKVGLLAAARVRPIRLHARAAKAKGKWAEVLQHCEDAFAHHPWDVGTAQDAAEAAEHLGQPALARWLLESVFPQGGDNAGFLRQLAHVYELNSAWEQAINCWEKIKRLVPHDEEANRRIRALSASATITRSGLGEAIHRHHEGGSGPEAAAATVAGLDELRRQVVSPEDAALKQIEEEPTRVGPYLDLADLYKKRNRLDEAEKVLARGMKAIPGDDLLASAHGDIQIARLHRAIDVYSRKAKEQPDDAETRDRLEQLREKLRDYELKEYRRRSERKPDDLALRFQVGLRLAKAGRHDEAIAEFQAARGAPSLKVQALHQAGLCFEAKNLPKLAERNYQEALTLADPSDTALINALHYRLGRVAESIGDYKAAEEHYNEVAANDYTYEDVADRLRALNQRRPS